jgi:hypothetical protein
LEYRKYDLLKPGASEISEHSHGHGRLYTPYGSVPGTCFLFGPLVKAWANITGQLPDFFKGVHPYLQIFFLSNCRGIGKYSLPPVRRGKGTNRPKRKEEKYEQQNQKGGN